MTAELNPKILVADGEHIIADTLVMILNHSGFDARAAYSGETAAELLAKPVHPMTLITRLRGNVCV